MFGNGRLPNIVPKHSFHSPPPSSIHLPPPPPSCAPASAHLGQAGAAHCRAPHTRVTTDYGRHVMTRRRLHHPDRHVTAINNRRQQPPDATSHPTTPIPTIPPPSTTPSRHVTVDKQPSHVKMAASPLLEGCRRRIQQPGSKEVRGGWEWGKGRGMRRQGKGRGEGEAACAPSFPFFSFWKPMRRCKNHTPSHSSLIPPSVDDGAVWYPHTSPFQAHLPAPMMGAV